MSAAGPRRELDAAWLDALEARWAMIRTRRWAVPEPFTELMRAYPALLRAARRGLEPPGPGIVVAPRRDSGPRRPPLRHAGTFTDWRWPPALIGWHRQDYPPAEIFRLLRSYRWDTPAPIVRCVQVLCEQRRLEREERATRGWVIAFLLAAAAVWLTLSLSSMLGGTS